MDSSQSSQTKFDPAKIIFQAFSYVKYFRLMLIVLALALLAGVSYFLYSTPLYQAKSLIHVQAYGNPVRNSELPETDVAAGANRALMARIQSQQVLIAAGVKLGLLDGEKTYEAFVSHIPKISVGFVDFRHLEVSVMAYDPEVVRNFTPALVEAYQEIQDTGWKEFRDQALERYQLQLTELEKKVAENVDSLTSMERDQKFTEITIEQQNLLEIPKQLVETRERLTRMDTVRKNMKAYESDQNADHTITILSLLSNFEKDSEVAVGNVISRPLAVGRTQVIPTTTTTDVQVITPADVQALEPWQDLEREQRTLEDQIKESSLTLLPGHPRMKELSENLESVKRSLQNELWSLREKFDLEYKRLTEKLAELQLRIPEYQEVTELVGRASLQYTSIERAQMMGQGSRAPCGKVGRCHVHRRLRFGANELQGSHQPS